MEARKLKQEELTRKIEELREQRRAKEKARLDKLRALNLKKSNSEGNPNNIFKNLELSSTQSRTKNSNSLADFRRKSMLPKPTDKPKLANLNKEVTPIETVKTNSGTTDADGPVTFEADSTTCNNLAKSVKDPEMTVNIPLIAVNDTEITVNDTVNTPSALAKVVSGHEKPDNTSIKTVNGPAAKSTEGLGKTISSVKSAGGIGQSSKPSIAPLAKFTSTAKTTGAVGVKTIQKPITSAISDKNSRQSMAFVPRERKSMAAGPSKLPPFNKYVPEKVSSTSVPSRIAIKKSEPVIPSKTVSVPKLKLTKTHSSTFKAMGKKDLTTSAKNPEQAKKDLPIPAKKPAQRESQTSKMSVFERLSKPKNQIEKSVGTHRKETIFEQKNRLVAAFANSRKSLAPVEAVKENVKKMRRSISAVHYKRVGKEELKNCFHRYSSFGEGMNNVDLTKINEDDPLVQTHIVSTIRSERKKTVKFATPRADELEHKLKSWLLRRGKSLDSFQHLRCFGVSRLAPADTDIFNNEPYDEENKENIAVSDDGSFTELMNDRDNDFDDTRKWRRASCFNDSEVYSECTDVMERSPVSTETPLPKAPVDQLLLGALNDLSQLVRDGYDWEQCARWLRAIRNRSPRATNLAAYWECRAALEECRGNLPRSFLCWEEAIAKGTETSVVEASLDQLLDKFMQLNISPSGVPVPALSRQDMQCAKNVFKTSLIRFAVQNAKAKSDTAAYIVTPVRRSSRLSMHAPSVVATPRDRRTPLLQLASSLKLIDQDIRDKSVFVPNKLLNFSP